MSVIDKKTLEHLAELARIKLDAEEEEKLLHDLAKILDHFKELNEVDTSKVEPLTGGTSLSNVMREDAVSRGDTSSSAKATEDRGKGRGAFPEHEGDHEAKFLKVPPMFE